MMRTAPPRRLGIDGFRNADSAARNRTAVSGSEARSAASPASMTWV